VDVVKELQSMVVPSNPLFLQYEAMFAHQFNDILYNTAVFCVNPQPMFISPTTADYVSGAYRTMVPDYASANAYFKLCEEY
jgi:hypothetical protein